MLVSGHYFDTVERNISRRIIRVVSIDSSEWGDHGSMFYFPKRAVFINTPYSEKLKIAKHSF